ILKKHLSGETLTPRERELKDKHRGSAHPIATPAAVIVGALILKARNSYWKNSTAEDRPLTSQICVLIGEWMNKMSAELSIGFFGSWGFGELPESRDTIEVFGGRKKHWPFLEKAMQIADLLWLARRGKEGSDRENGRAEALRRATEAESKRKQADDGEAMFTVADLESRYEIPEESSGAFRSQINRWKEKHQEGDGWKELKEVKGSRQPGMVFQLKAIEPVILKFKARLNKSAV